MPVYFSPLSRSRRIWAASTCRTCRQARRASGHLQLLSAECHESPCSGCRAVAAGLLVSHLSQVGFVTLRGRRSARSRSRSRSCWSRWWRRLRCRLPRGDASHGLVSCSSVLRRRWIAQSPAPGMRLAAPAALPHFSGEFSRVGPLKPAREQLSPLHGESALWKHAMIEMGLCSWSAHGDAPAGLPSRLRTFRTRHSR